MAKKKAQNIDLDFAFFEYLHQTGINLVPQWYFPGDDQRRLEDGDMMHEHRPGGTESITGSEDILAIIDRLPSDSEVEAEFDIEAEAQDYADRLRKRTDRATLVING